MPQLPNADGIVEVSLPRCQMCGHVGPHGLTPQDFHDAEAGELAYKGHCSECKECQDGNITAPNEMS